MRKTSLKEQFVIHALLTEHLAITADGLYTYRHDMDDEKIAKLAAPDLKANHVERIRRELFGELHVVKATPIDRRIKDLSDRVTGIYSRLDRIEGAIHCIINNEMPESVVNEVRKILSVTHTE